MTNEPHHVRELIRTLIPWVMLGALILYGAVGDSGQAHDYIRALQERVAKLEEWQAKNQQRLDEFDAGCKEILESIRRSTSK